jgi:hypothetical protein
MMKAPTGVFESGICILGSIPPSLSMFSPGGPPGFGGGARANGESTIKPKARIVKIFAVFIFFLLSSI